MIDYLHFIAPLFGIFGVLVGALLNEFLRRGNRREIYAPVIFEKRLAAYEGLVEKIDDGHTVACEVIESDNFSQEQRHEIVSAIVIETASYADKNRLYLDEELAVHCGALFMGVEDIYEANEGDKKELLDHYYQKRRDALRMVEEDSGVAEINRLFKVINKPKIDSQVIQHLRRVKR